MDVILLDFEDERKGARLSEVQIAHQLGDSFDFSVPENFFHFSDFLVFQVVFDVRAHGSALFDDLHGLVLVLQLSEMRIDFVCAQLLLDVVGHLVEDQVLLYRGLPFDYSLCLLNPIEVLVPPLALFVAVELVLLLLDGVVGKSTFGGLAGLTSHKPRGALLLL